MLPFKAPHFDFSHGHSFDHQDDIQAKLTKAVHKELVFIDKVGYVPGSVDGMSAVLKAKQIYTNTGIYDGKVGPQAYKQWVKDDLKMFKGLDDAQANQLVDQLGP